MNTVSLEVGWHRALWAVQPGRGSSILFGEVPLGDSLKGAVAKAAREAREALAAEDEEAGLEVVVAFDGSLLWPTLHKSAVGVLLAVSPALPGSGAPYDEEAGGRLIKSLLSEGASVAVGQTGAWQERVQPVAEAARGRQARVVALALRGGLERPSEERAAERALHDALPGVPVLISSDVAPLWGWSDRPLEKTVVSAALLPVVQDAAQGAREGLGDAELRVWFASLDGTIIPLTLAERHPYAVLRGLPILSLTAALAYGREVAGLGPVAAVSLHETSTALARLPGRPEGQSFESVLMGARIESVGVGAESRVFLERGALTIADERAPSGAVPVRAILAASGLVDGPDGAKAAHVLGEWLSLPPEAAVGAALRTVADRLGTRLRAAFVGAQSAVFTGPNAGALAGELGRRVGFDEVLLPPAFGACAAIAARRAPRAARAAETVAPAPGGWTQAEAARVLEETIAVAVGDLEDAGLRRDVLAAVAWVGGAKDAHGAYPALERTAIAKAADGIVRDSPAHGPITVEVEVYPAVGERETRFPELNAPVAAPGSRKVVLPGAAKAVELRIVPSGALSADSPTRGPALLADPTGFILVPEGMSAAPAPLGGTRLTRASP